MNENENIELKESIDDILKRVQILKIENELQDSKKNYFKKFIYPELPKWIPVLFFGIITLWITTTKDIIGAKEDKLVAKQDKVAIDEKTFELKKIEENIKKLNEVQISKKNSVKSLDVQFFNKLSEIKGLNDKISSYQKLYDNERDKAEKLGQIQFELTSKNNLLNIESSNIKVDLILDRVYNNPIVNTKYIFEIIEILKSKSGLSDLISKEIENNIKKSFHNPINYFILFISSKNEKYLNSLTDLTKQVCFSSKGTFDNATIDELVYILQSKSFNKNEHEIISKVILENIPHNIDLKGNIIQLVTLPGYYFQSIYNFDSSFIDETFWINYIAFNNKLLKIKNEFEKSKFESAEFRKNQYNYFNRLDDKKELLYNLYKSFPQVAFAHFIEMFSKVNWNSVTGIQSENYILGQFLIDISKDEYTKCESLYNIIDGNLFLGNIDEKSDINELVIQLNNSVTNINKFKLLNVKKLNNWIDEEMEYFLINKEEFKNKLKACEF